MNSYIINKKTVLFFDVDGTLVDEKNVDYSILNQYRRMGINIGIATGRSPLQATVIIL